MLYFIFLYIYILLSPHKNIIRMIKENKVCRSLCTRGREVHTKSCLAHLNNMGYLAGLSIDGRIILKLIAKK